MALVRHLHGIKHQLAVGGGENITHRLDVQHTLAHKTGLGGLMAAVGDDGHPVGIGQILTDDQVAVHIQNVRISQTQAHQLFVGDRLRRVHELLHFHTAFLQ